MPRERESIGIPSSTTRPMQRRARSEAGEALGIFAQFAHFGCCDAGIRHSAANYFSPPRDAEFRRREPARRATSLCLSIGARTLSRNDNRIAAAEKMTIQIFRGALSRAARARRERRAARAKTGCTPPSTDRNMTRTKKICVGMLTARNHVFSFRPTQGG
jgi:hypothetical protein